jgi:hypothetical protein
MKCLLLFAPAVFCFAQTPPPAVSPPAISAFYRLAGQAVSPDEGKTSGFVQYKWALVDSPLTFTFDLAGAPHLGVSGAVGATGPSGADGLPGTAGPAGASGAPGATGQQGGAGAAGAAGAAGPPGATGAAGSVVGMTVETGCATAAGCVVLGTATTLDVEPGIGTLCVPQLDPTKGVMTLQCSSDTSIIAYRVDVPTGAGPCVDPLDKHAYGASVWASDASGFYTCVLPPGTVLPLAPGVPLVLVWSRTAATVSW